FNKRIYFGAGYFLLNSNSVVDKIEVEDHSLHYKTNGELRFNFFSVSAEYTFYNKYPWQFSFLPFQAGIGSAHYDYIRQSDTLRVSTPSETVWIYQPGISGQYSIFKWFGLGADIGY